MGNSHAALIWIVRELQDRQIPFAITGGLAAIAYGGTRSLNDIDIDVPDSALSTLSVELAEFLIFGPERSVSKEFDCLLLGLSYQGQLIELGGAESFRIFDSNNCQWCAWPTDLAKVEYRVVLGIKAPVMSRDMLLAYKRMVGRETDLIDVAEISRHIEV